MHEVTSEEKLTRLIRCPSCGIKKVTIKKIWYPELNITTLNTFCSNKECNMLIHSFNKNGNHLK